MAGDPDLDLDLDLDSFPHMVRWFSPRVMFHSLKGVVLSAWFGSYADQRFIQGALDHSGPERLLKRTDLTAEIPTDPDGAAWVDFVADIGDGFDETYAVAYLLGQPELWVESVGGAEKLPRGSALIVGGDLAYPTPSHRIYKENMRRPYALAQPDDQREGAHHPRLFAIPGNHDWYDGLSAFYGTFCRAQDSEPVREGLRIGNWRSKQHRSYFAVRLPHDWWIWGVDIQLSGFIDEPQVNYFRLIAASLGRNAKIIICTAKPSWLDAVQYGELAYDSINYIARIARGVLDSDEGSPRHNVYAIFSGDMHHYNRYETDEGGPQLITAGGGGAFAHSTHNLPDRLSVPNLDVDIKADGREEMSYQLARGGTACYPPRAESFAQLPRNIAFAFRNWDFSLGVGLIYWIAAWFFVSHESGSLFDTWAEIVAELGSPLLAWPQVVLTTLVTSPSLAILVAGIFASLFYFADTRRTWFQLSVAAAHTVAHLATFLGLAFLFGFINAGVLGLDPDGLLSKTVFAAEMVSLGGFAGGTVFGLYLMICSMWLNIHGAEAFSALRIGKYRNFLRLRLSADSLVIYPIGLRDVPARGGWRINPQARRGTSVPRIEPVNPLKPFFIEPPIVIATAARCGEQVEDQGKTTAPGPQPGVKGRSGGGQD